MSDIRKRTGRKGTTYQVRYSSPSTKSGYAYKTFDTRKAARDFLESGRAREGQGTRDAAVRTVPQAVDRWLEICRREGRDGRDPVTAYTMKTYGRRADIMKSYDWPKPLADLQTPDVVAFRSWLLSHYSRHLAHKTLGSFHAVIKEAALRGWIHGNVAAGVSISAGSRYDTPVTIPSAKDVAALLSAADRLANATNPQIARSWRRYRPILYLAADSGMRPQEYLVIGKPHLGAGGIHVERALERGGKRLSVPKTRAGRRFIDLSPEALALVTHYAEHHAVDNDDQLVFPTATGRWQEPENWRKRGFYRACFEAGLVDETEEETGERVLKPRYSPYDLRHFYASMLIEQGVNIKRIQALMGHEDVKTTLNVYGHLMDKVDGRGSQGGLLSHLEINRCGEVVADQI